MQTTHADLYKNAREFNGRDHVMVQIRSEWYSFGTVKKLHEHNVGPFKILIKINPNAYIVDVSPDFCICP